MFWAVAEQFQGAFRREGDPWPVLYNFWSKPRSPAIITKLRMIVGALGASEGPVTRSTPPQLPITLGMVSALAAAEPDRNLTCGQPRFRHKPTDPVRDKAVEHGFAVGGAVTTINLHTCCVHVYGPSS